MTKKIVLCLLVVFSLICLTGCDINSEVIDKLLESMKKQNIVEKDVELVDEVESVFTGYLYSKTKYYIYEAKDGKLLAINYKNNIHAETDYDYLVTIYKDVDLNNDVEYLDDKSKYEQTYSYKDGSVTDKNKYILNEKDVYEVNEKDSLFSTKYNFELKK